MNESSPLLKVQDWFILFLTRAELNFVMKLDCMFISLSNKFELVLVVLD